ncbi:hypothetical protein GCM10022393_25680 [Aquimarina addita]|uniref:F5/8 type C domain-containing protein n=1 Tax=Aquimarina addita TaxID=870485 RepID=A0ABP6UPY1_9FLAO
MSFQVKAQTTVSSLAELRAAVQNSNQEIVMQSGDYNLEDLASSSRNILFTGNNNTINLTGVYIDVPVGSVSSAYIIVSGDDNTIIGGEIEDTYRNGMTEVTDFSAYNQDRTNLANGLGGDAVMNIEGDDNLIDGLKLTTRGSYPYGYGSMYGIGSDNVYGLDKRCGILITGKRNTIDHVELQQRAFGHGIFMQGDADETVIKNTLVEGRVRATAELYQETNSFDLPYRSNYKMPLDDNAPIPTDEVHSLCEDGFRMYNIPGSITVENCTAKKMRGGVRLYLGGPATVNNTTSIDCGATNWNMPSGGNVINSSGNFAYAPLSDFRLSRSNMDIEWTIIPSPHAEGPHNLADVLGNNHNIVFHRTPGPLDSDEERAIVISGDNSTIVNETEYKIILESSASGNTIVSCGPVTDNGAGNNVSSSGECIDTTTPPITDNLALYGVATQSSLDYDGAASRAIDGNTSGIWNQESVTHTANEANPWWQVDLSTTKYIGDITIFNRTDCCTTRLSDFTVSVIDSDGNTTFSQNYMTTPSPSLTLNAGNVQGKIIRVQLNTSNALSLAEVQVFEGETSIGTSSIVHIKKRNATSFAIDGNHGGDDAQNIYLWSQNSTNKNQQWMEIDRGNGYYSYQKQDTNYCIDGNSGGAQNQNVYLWTCNENNQNQHWEKVDVGSGAYKLIKRNASGYALNGGSGGADGQNVNLYSSSSSSQNLHWIITPISDSKEIIEKIKADFEVYPIPFSDILNIQLNDSQSEAKVDIVNLTGQIVFSKRITSNTSTIPLNKLISGVYIVKVTGDNKTISKLITKK